MRSIRARTYFLSRTLLLIAGLRKKDFELISVIGLVSIGGEKIVFSTEEFSQFCIQGRELEKYFTGKCKTLNLRLPNHEVLLLHGNEKEIVLKCKHSWNSIRMNRIEFENLLNFSSFAQKYLEKIEKKRSFLTYKMNCLIFSAIDKIDGTSMEIDESFSKCKVKNPGIFIPNPPEVTKGEIFYELKVLVINEDPDVIEMIHIYGDDLSNEILFQLRFKRNPFALDLPMKSEDQKQGGEDVAY